MGVFKKYSLEAGLRLLFGGGCCSCPCHLEDVDFKGLKREVTEVVKGMPESWARLLQSSNISKSEQKKNPQAVLDVLNYYDNYYDSSTNSKKKYMTSIHQQNAHQAQNAHHHHHHHHPQPLTDRFASGAVITPQKPKVATPPTTPEEDNDPPPPPVAVRPEKTKSIYTKPIEPAPQTPVPPKNERQRKKKKVPTATLR